ncbi:uncharacterized protein LOC143461968 [Clavelina lepadiformis]|uniref:Nucleolus and neural progenitor protein-like N-terminal domain-containing protein n=1 Tax=Clavelina lepadiformis TaxID=159417 RepID=A0ABP0GL08_CLALP
MDTLVPVFNNALKTLGKQTELSFELGMLSQIAYKHNSAQRRHKFFQSLKKIERCMREFTQLNLIVTLKKEMSLFPENAQETPFAQFITRNTELIRIAYALLCEAKQRCLEIVKQCLLQLNIHHFIPLHTLLTSICSKISILVDNLSTNFADWYKQFSCVGHRVGIKVPDLKIAEEPLLVTQQSNSLNIHALTSGSSKPQEFKASSTLHKMLGGNSINMSSCKSNETASDFSSPLEPSTNSQMQLGSLDAVTEEHDIGVAVKRTEVQELPYGTSNEDGVNNGVTSNSKMQTSHALSSDRSHTIEKGSILMSNAVFSQNADKQRMQQETLTTKKLSYRVKRTAIVPSKIDDIFAKKHKRKNGNTCNRPLKLKPYHYSFLFRCRKVTCNW